MNHTDIIGCVLIGNGITIIVFSLYYYKYAQRI